MPIKLSNAIFLSALFGISSPQEDCLIFNSDTWTTIIGYGTFDSRGNPCPKVVDIPEGVDIIGNYAFVNVGLTKVTLPEGITTIQHAAFWGNDLTELVIPKSVKRISYRAFHRNPRLTSVCIKTYQYHIYVDTAAFDEAAAVEYSHDCADE